MFLVRTAAQVHILMRADRLATIMSDYLVQHRAKRQDPRTEITTLAGDDRLREVTWSKRGSGASDTWGDRQHLPDDRGQA